ncbi:MAG: efflux RND transporter periplasmic adaptor subunit [Deltaproteobacteria bacterium]|nr:efflux RND transporter periplasmic adaptor subunit [Deltaproteobacteria bacterium]
MKKTTLNLLCLILLPLSYACDREEVSQQPPPPQEVTVFETKAQPVPIYQESVGQVYGYQDIAISARVEGFLEGIHFEEGSRVKKGQLLYTLESQQFEADVAAKMSDVASAKTVLAEAKTYLNRIKPLARENAVSQSDLDSAQARYDVAVSSVQAAQANLRAAKIQLGYTQIHSPITGIIGKTQAKVGDFVGRSPNPIILNTVSRIDTVLVDFFITESQYLEAMRHFLADTQKEASKTAPEPDLELVLSDGTIYGHKGKADFMGREVDPDTGAIMIQASFPNPDQLLRPGQFARVRAQVNVVKEGILIPQRCVKELQGSFSVYVVDHANKIRTREIQVGPKVRSFWLILKGLNPGEKVVYEGLQKVQDGALVTPVVKDIPLPQKVTP